MRREAVHCCTVEIGTDRWTASSSAESHARPSSLTMGVGITRPGCSARAAVTSPHRYTGAPPISPVGFTVAVSQRAASIPGQGNASAASCAESSEPGESAARHMRRWKAESPSIAHHPRAGEEHDRVGAGDPPSTTTVHDGSIRAHADHARPPGHHAPRAEGAEHEARALGPSLPLAPKVSSTLECVTVKPGAYPGATHRPRCANRRRYAARAGEQRRGTSQASPNVRPQADAREQGANGVRTRDPGPGGPGRGWWQGNSRSPPWAAERTSRKTAGRGQTTPAPTRSVPRKASTTPTTSGPWAWCATRRRAARCRCPSRPTRTTAISGQPAEPSPASAG